MRYLTRKNVLLLAVVIIITLSASVLVLPNTTITIPGKGTVRLIGVGIYWDSDCNNKVSSIDWGPTEPGAKNVTIYIRNEGYTAIFLSLNTTNWEPLASSNYITLNWNYEGQIINPNEVIQITLTLEISTAVKFSGIKNFNFDITITGKLKQG